MTEREEERASLGNGGDGEEERPPQPSLFERMARGFLIYLVVTRFIPSLFGSSSSSSSNPSSPRMADDHDDTTTMVFPPSSGESSSSAAASLVETWGIPVPKALPYFPTHAANGRQFPPHRNLFLPGELMDLSVYLSNHDTPLNLSDPLIDPPTWREERLAFDWEEGNTHRSLSFNVTVTPAIREQNCSVFAHIFVAKHGAVLDDAAEGYDPRAVSYKLWELFEYRAPPKRREAHSLLAKEGGEDAADLELAEREALYEEHRQNGTFMPFWKPALSLHLVHDFTRYPRNQIPPQFGEHMSFDMASGDYHPIVYVSEFWLQREQWMAVNESVLELPLEMSYAPIGLWKFQMQNQMEMQWRMQERMGTSGDGESDVIKQMLMDTNPVLLAVTFAVSLLHMVFDMLAFKNDISFWKRNKSLEGLSVRTICLNCVFQLVILLYLLDNETSWMILFSSGIGLVIEVWKISKAMTASLEFNVPGRLLPRLKVEHKESYAKSKTKEYDEVATSHLLYVVLPLVLGYSVYSLLHGKHKGWYSWVISSMVGFIYMFGFVMMTPQLFINYKLKSVAHLPWRAMVYKSLNTFIDDLFAFIIKMPIMHRLSCFRDDLVFFIFLYQRWIYRVDYTRVNEFGQCSLPSEEMIEDARKAAAGGDAAARRLLDKLKIQVRELAEKGNEDARKILPKLLEEPLSLKND